MCGIFGTTRYYDDKVIDRKLDLMKFRGPNYQAFVRIAKNDGLGELTLGHVRLSIMDLEARSNQPFSYDDNITVVFNGEIYNFEELKKLYLPDFQFKTTSDTEVLCAMYKKYGANCVRYFNGMFAYVIFDRKRNVLVGARDRLGKKPFYYWLTKNSFEFASQLNPICYKNDFHISGFSRQLFLLNGYISDPYSIYDEVRKLRAGECFELDLNTFSMKIDQYWDIFSNSCHFSVPKSYEEAREQVKELLFDSVKIRLHADVPVGMFLSGGIDSSLISAIVSSYNKNITAYTIGFNDQLYNESSHAYNVAKALGIPIKVSKCEGDDMLQIVKDISYYYDEPFADNSLIPTSLLAQKTKEDVTVALGGDGGDELFFGYNSYFKLKEKKRIYDLLPYSVRKGLYEILRHVKQNNLIDLLRYEKLYDTHIARFGYGSFGDAFKLDPLNLSKCLPDLDYVANKKRGILAFSDYDMKHYMNSCINTKTDRASMRSSLELRSPIMDYRLAEYSRLLPLDYLYSKTWGGQANTKRYFI